MDSRASDRPCRADYAPPVELLRAAADPMHNKKVRQQEMRRARNRRAQSRFRVKDKVWLSTPNHQLAKGSGVLSPLRDRDP